MNSTPIRLLSPKDTMILAFLGETFKIYRESSLFFLDNLDLTCPLCLGSTTWHCWYKRQPKGEDEPILILRVKCDDCGKTHAVLPDLLSPYKHYPQQIREQVIKQATEDGIPVEHVIPEDDPASKVWPSIATMRLWVRHHKKNAGQYIGAVISLLERHGITVSNLGQGFRHFRTLIDLTRRLMRRSIRGSCLLGKINILLAIARPGLWI